MSNEKMGADAVLALLDRVEGIASRSNKIDRTKVVGRWACENINVIRLALGNYAALIAERDALTDKLTAYNSALEHIAASCDGRAAEVARVAIQMNRNEYQS